MCGSSQAGLRQATALYKQQLQEADCAGAHVQQAWCCASRLLLPPAGASWGRERTFWKLSTSKRLNPGLHLLQYTSGGLAMYVFLEQASHFPNSTGPAADLQFAAAGQAPEGPGDSKEHGCTAAAGRQGWGEGIRKGA